MLTKKEINIEINAHENKIKELNRKKAELKWSELGLKTDLPFFTYGIFRPGEIPFLIIQDQVKDIIPLTIKGYLKIRDGIHIYEDHANTDVHGYLIYFKDGQNEEAYNNINQFESDKIYKWITKKEGPYTFNMLEGFKSDVGSESYIETIKHLGVEDYKTTNDPYFKDAIDILNEWQNKSEENKKEPVHKAWNKRFFEYQMRYLFLWTIIERLAYLLSQGGSITANLNQLETSKHYQEHFIKTEIKEKKVISTERADKKEALKPNKPKNSLNFYYQVRCNLTHRGKGAKKDLDIISESFDELLKIITGVITDINKECILLENKWTMYEK